MIDLIGRFLLVVIEINEYKIRYNEQCYIWEIYNMIQSLLQHWSHMLCGYIKVYCHRKIFSQNDLCIGKDFRQSCQKSCNNKNSKISCKRRVYFYTYSSLSFLFRFFTSFMATSLVFSCPQFLLISYIRYLFYLLRNYSSSQLLVLCISSKTQLEHISFIFHLVKFYSSQPFNRVVFSTIILHQKLIPQVSLQSLTFFQEEICLLTTLCSSTNIPICYIIS